MDVCLSCLAERSILANITTDRTYCTSLSIECMRPLHYTTASMRFRRSAKLHIFSLIIQNTAAMPLQEPFK